MTHTLHRPENYSEATNAAPRRLRLRSNRLTVNYQLLNTIPRSAVWSARTQRTALLHAHQRARTNAKRGKRCCRGNGVSRSPEDALRDRNDETCRSEEH